MSKVLAYHNMKDGEDFIVSEFYKDKQIDAIPDPEGGHTTKPPTSIPSPFAIIDLAATAFQKISETNTLKGHTIYEKIVSDCLDVGMVFFNAKGLGDKVRIIVWNKKEELDKLRSSGHNGHSILGDTLAMYLSDDAKAYNFGEWQNNYILHYNHNYLGGISPKTLFYSTLNPLSADEGNHINLGDDHTLFDTNYAPLYSRPEDFQIYLYTLVKNIEGFSEKCRELNNYLVKNKEILRTKNRGLFEKIAAIKNEDLKKYTPLDTGKSGSYVIVLGKTISCKSPKTDGASDFKIQSTKYSGRIPLVLYPGFGGQNLFGETMNYFDNQYTKEIGESIPYYSNVPIAERELPGMTGIKYPYLLVDDLLEDTLFYYINPFNEEHFFNSGLSGESDGYLCPLKQLIFDFYDTDFIISGKVDDGKPVFEMEKRAGGSVKAYLRIPVSKGYITFEKTYINGGKPEPDKNIGQIEALDFELNIFPFIKFDPSQEIGASTDEQNEYRTQFIFTNMDLEPSVEFYKNDGSGVPSIEAKSSTPDNRSVETHITKGFYDYLLLKYKGNSMTVIPKWSTRESPSEEFHFAIDFGTSYTNILYQKNKEEPGSFSLAKGAIGSLSLDEQYSALTERYLLPVTVDQSSSNRFPQRTAIAANKSLDYLKPVHTIADLRIPFFFEYNLHSKNSDYYTNLKWSNFVNSGEDQKRVEAFLEQLVLMIKSKVLFEGGKIKSTRFTWFYPSSMMRSRVASLEKLWLSLIKKHFYIEKDRITKISESIAPYAYFEKRESVNSLVRPAVTIDIGGGTSDIVIFKEDLPLCLTSFRFAANSIFGDGYASNPQKNGFETRYYSRISEALSANELHSLEGALKSIKSSTHNSADTIAFFMSLESNPQVKGKYDISFQKMLLNDEQLKLVVLLAYFAIIYHLAKLIKDKNEDVPNAIIFSGNGGKLIKLIDDSVDHELLSEYTSIIFREILGHEESKDIKLILSKKPKASTCLGGLYADDDVKVDAYKINEVLVGSEDQPAEVPFYPELKKNNITESVLKEIGNSLDLFFSLDLEFNYRNNFEIDAGAVKYARDLLSKEELIKEHFLRGLRLKEKELGANINVELEETLFFYPYVGFLNQLAYELTTKLRSS